MNGKLYLSFFSSQGLPFGADEFRHFSKRHSRILLAELRPAFGDEEKIGGYRVFGSVRVTLTTLRGQVVLHLRHSCNLILISNFVGRGHRVVLRTQNINKAQNRRPYIYIFYKLNTFS